MSRRSMKPVAAVVLIAWLAGLPTLRAQDVAGPELWRSFAQTLEPGKTLKVRLKSGQRFKATLLQVSTEAMIVQPRTRAAVPAQRVPFDDIETLEVDRGNGLGVGKAVAIGAGVGAGVWLALMTLAFAVWGD